VATHLRRGGFLKTTKLLQTEKK